MKVKSIKDAVHGYIQLEEPFWRVIDIAEFQRLKWIEQTSYRVLYPSARHDRFIHSIGTYHLGKKAFEGFSKNCSKLLSDCNVLENYKNSFLLACLLHDIGHAPFSHTCENLYNYQSKVRDIDSPLNKQLYSAIENSTYLNESEKITLKEDYGFIADNIKLKAPSEHEIMSCILIINKYEIFCNIFTDLKLNVPNLDLVIRAIIGCTYGYGAKNSEPRLRENIGIKNCLIRLLNSPTVDVDKLDYIARDTMMSGYESIVLDNDRLLNSLSFIKKSNNTYYPAFNKSVLSVIDNVIIAKNAQAKWIVGHPIVMYESYLLKKSIGVAFKQLYQQVLLEDEDLKKLDFDSFIRQLFSQNTLSKEGGEIGKHHFRLLSDVDIIYFLKKTINNDVIEFFERDKRKRPIWKSHEEYRYYLSEDEKSCEKVAEFFMPLIMYCEKIEDLSNPISINKSFIDNIRGNVHDEDGVVEILKVLEDYCILTNHQDDFNFVFLSVKNSFSTEIDSSKTFIRFGDSDSQFITYDKLQGNKSSSKSKSDESYKFFYVFSNFKVDTKSFLKFVLEKIDNIAVEHC